MRKDEYKDISGLYVPSGSYDTNLRNFRLEDMLAKLLKGVEKTNDFLKEIKVDI